jgi:hypothetical protein
MREGGKGLSSTKRRKNPPFAKVSTIRTDVYLCNPHLKQNSKEEGAAIDNGNML